MHFDNNFIVSLNSCDNSISFLLIWRISVHSSSNLLMIDDSNRSKPHQHQLTDTKTIVNSVDSWRSSFPNHEYRRIWDGHRDILSFDLTGMSSHLQRYTEIQRHHKSLVLDAGGGRAARMSETETIVGSVSDGYQELRPTQRSEWSACDSLERDKQ
jgi:hypothetical protein